MGKIKHIDVGDTLTQTEWESENTHLINDEYGLNIVRSATFVIAADNSSTSSKAMADYVCNGIDDDVEIQDAIDACVVLGGGLVQLLEGTFDTSNFIDWDGVDNVTVRGVGMRATIIEQQQAAKEIMKCTTGGNYNRILDMSCRHNSGLSPSVHSLHLYNTATALYNWEIRNVEISYQGTSKYALYLGRFLGCIFEHIYSDQGGGFICVDSPNNGLIGDSIFTECTAAVKDASSPSIFKLIGYDLSNPVVDLLFMHPKVYWDGTASDQPSTYLFDINKYCNDIHLIQPHLEGKCLNVMNVGSGCFNLTVDGAEVYSSEAGDTQIDITSQQSQFIVSFRNCEFDSTDIVVDSSIPPGNVRIENCEGYNVQGAADVYKSDRVGHLISNNSMESYAATDGVSISSDGYLSIATSATLNEEQTCKREFYIPINRTNFWMSDMQLYISFIVSDITSQTVYMVTGSCEPVTDRHIGVMIDGADLYLTVADGTTQTTVDTGINVVAWSKYIVRFYKNGSKVCCSVNGDYKCEASSNVPASSSTDAEYKMYVYLKALEANSKAVRIGQWYVTT